MQKFTIQEVSAQQQMVTHQQQQFLLLFRIVWLKGIELVLMHA
jgi:hypothetical protein